MTRHIESKKAIPSAARTPADLASKIVGPAGRPSILDILLRPFRRARIARELRMLDERMLRDIGLTRSDIDRIAALSVGGEEWVVVSLAKHLAHELVAWFARRDAYRRLMALDNRMLADIGLTRAEIPALVRSMNGRAGAQARSSFEAEVILPLRQWNLWRDAHKQLNQLDNHMLSDIGLVRGDLDRVADELADRALRSPANLNSTAPRAA
jgi:uncharacterized protein YjiS (DUF1127 family)